MLKSLHVVFHRFNHTMNHHMDDAIKTKTVQLCILTSPQTGVNDHGLKKKVSLIWNLWFGTLGFVTSGFAHVCLEPCVPTFLTHTFSVSHNHVVVFTFEA